MSERDVRHIAALARLGLDPARVPVLVRELNGILGHMAVLQRVDTRTVAPVVGIGAGGMPLRADEGPPYPMTREPAAFAPEARDGFFLVPRLDAHAEAGGPTAPREDDA